MVATVLGLSMTMDAVGVVAAESPVQLAKRRRVPLPWSTVVGVMESVAVEPASYQPAPVDEPKAEVRVNWYWVFQVAFTVLGEFIIIDVAGVVAVESPLQLLNVWRVAFSWSIKAGISNCAVAFSSYQSEPLGEP